MPGVFGKLAWRYGCCWALLALASASQAASYDLVIANGRVIDPQTRLDAIRHVGVNGDKIVAVSTSLLTGKRTLNAAGLVVAPGFIDLHAHGQDVRSNQFQVRDGVTTAFEAEIGVLPLKPWLQQRAGHSRPNFGATAGHLAARVQLLTGIEVGNPIYSANTIARDAAVDYANQPLDPGQRNALAQLVAGGLAAGAVGIGIGSTYTPGADQAEIYRMFLLAAQHDVPVFIHLRQARQLGGNNLAPLQEALANAAATGAALHVVHINSTMNEDVQLAMQMIRGARAQGLDVTTESYPYTAGSTRIESALYDNFTGDYGQLQWTLTGERLTAESFAEYRKQGGWVISHGRNEITNTWVVAQPDIIIASDGVPFLGDASHPRGAGTYARVLGHYVRDLAALDLMSGLAKMTIDPARRLQHVPAMRSKGRVQVGADADLVIFSAAEILDQATYTLPARPSAGIVHVLVNGVAVVADGELMDVYPGRAVTMVAGE